MKKSKLVLEFEERKEIIALITKRDKDKHLMKMKEFLFLRESEMIHHHNEMERQRIKTAEIRKAQERRDWSKFHEGSRG